MQTLPQKVRQAAPQLACCTNRQFKRVARLTTAELPAAERLQLTFAIIKPDVCSQPSVFDHVEEILDRHFITVRSKLHHYSRIQMQDFYRVHEGKFYFQRATEFMSSGPLCAKILARKREAIAYWRSIMGPTKVYAARLEAPLTIRGMFGISDTRNCVHGSDSSDTFLTESKFFFPDFDRSKWIHSEEGVYLLSIPEKKLNQDLPEHYFPLPNCSIKLGSNNQ